MKTTEKNIDFGLSLSDYHIIYSVVSSNIDYPVEQIKLQLVEALDYNIKDEHFNLMFYLIGSIDATEKAHQENNKLFLLWQRPN